KVAVIGAGPAGMSCACELRILGFNVDIFEAKSHPSGLTIYGVAPYKITNQDVLEEMDYLEKQFGYKIFYNNPIAEKNKLKQMETEYDAVFLGIGLGNTTEIGIAGENLKNCVGCNLCSLVCPVENCITMVRQDDGCEVESWKARTEKGNVPTTWNDNLAGGVGHYVPKPTDALNKLKSK
ncbi:NAD(P)-binding protein, partial [Calditrichota bacterium]